MTDTTTEQKVEEIASWMEYGDREVRREAGEDGRRKGWAAALNMVRTDVEKVKTTLTGKVAMAIIGRVLERGLKEDG